MLLSLISITEKLVTFTLNSLLLSQCVYLLFFLPYHWLMKSYLLVYIEADNQFIMSKLIYRFWYVSHLLLIYFPMTSRSLITMTYSILLKHIMSIHYCKFFKYLCTYCWNQLFNQSKISSVLSKSIDLLINYLNIDYLAFLTLKMLF
jgi:hypothetical protein